MTLPATFHLPSLIAQVRAEINELVNNLEVAGGNSTDVQNISFEVGPAGVAGSASVECLPHADLPTGSQCALSAGGLGPQGTWTLLYTNATEVWGSG